MVKGYPPPDFLIVRASLFIAASAVMLLLNAEC